AVGTLTSLREVDVQPRRLDVPEQLVLRHFLVVLDGWDDVPVTEGDVTRSDRDRARVLEVHLPGLDREDRRPVRGRDVDPEVERPRVAGDARVVEVPANRMHVV